jgi:hypothetical protein
LDPKLCRVLEFVTISLSRFVDVGLSFSFSLPEDMLPFVFVNDPSARLAFLISELRQGLRLYELPQPDQLRSAIYLIADCTVRRPRYVLDGVYVQDESSYRIAA